MDLWECCCQMLSSTSLSSRMLIAKEMTIWDLKFYTYVGDLSRAVDNEGELVVL